MQRSVIELRLFHEMSLKEVATVTGSIEDAAKASFHHGVKSPRSPLPS